MSNSSIQYVDTKFGKLAYQTDGQGPGLPLLLLQRFRGTMDEWDPEFITGLSKDRKVIRFDSAGIGRSEGTTPDNVEGMAEIVPEFLKAIGLTQVDVLGWSLGGFVAQHVALDKPSLVRRLIIAGSGPGGVPEGPAPHERVPEIATKAVNVDGDYLFLFFTETANGLKVGQESVDRIKALPNQGPVTRAESFMRQGKALGDWKGVRERLPLLKQPVLVANGVYDVMVPAYGSYVISQEAPDAKLILYPDAGHGFLFQYIPEFLGEVDAFLS